METPIVTDLMVPLDEYATISEEATLYEAVTALDEAKPRFDKTRHQHRAILVFDKNNHITGKISQLDVIRGLEQVEGSAVAGAEAEALRQDPADTASTPTVVKK